VTVLVALGGLASIHLPHKHNFGEWYFHRRHAIICIFAFYLSLLFLLRQPLILFRLVGIAIIAASLHGIAVVQHQRVLHALQAEPPVGDGVLISWLERRVKEEGPIVVAMYAFKPPEFAWRTEGVGYHWYYERSSLDTLTLMADELGADYLIIDQKHSDKWSFRENDPEFRYRFKCSAIPRGTSQACVRRRSGASTAPERPVDEPDRSKAFEGEAQQQSEAD
jgi:hypothetical protein